MKRHPIEDAATFHAPPGASVRIYPRICMHVAAAAALATGLSAPAPLLGADIPSQGPVAYETTLLHQFDQRMRGPMEIAGQAAARADDLSVGAFAATLRERLPRIIGALDTAPPHESTGPQTLDDDDQDLARRLNTLSGDTVDDAFTQGAAHHAPRPVTDR